LRITSAYELGADDLGVFLALAGQAGLIHYNPLATQGLDDRGRLRGGFTKNLPSDERQLVFSLFLEKRAQGGGIGDVDAAQRLVAQGNRFYLAPTRHTLLTEAGLSSSGSAYEAIGDCLERLSAVHLTDLGSTGQNERRATRRSGDELLAYENREGDPRIHVLLNAALAEPIIGRPYVAVDLREMRQLGDVGRILHTYLCADVHQGSNRTYAIDDLVAAVYGAAGSITSAELRKRRFKLRHHALGSTALNKAGRRRDDGPKVIADLRGWAIEWGEQSATVTIRRPQMAPASIKGVPETSR
jgi:hypothetical protein